MRRLLFLLPLLLVVVAGLVVGPASPACACSCVPNTPSGHIDVADAVVDGVVTAVAPFEDRGGGQSSEGYEMTVRVTSTFKGTGLGPELTVRTALHEASCGQVLPTGVGYRIHLQRDGDGWWTGLCSGNVALATAGPAPTEERTATDVPVEPGPHDVADPRPTGRDTTLRWSLVALGAVVVAVGAAVLWRRRRSP